MSGSEPFGAWYLAPPGRFREKSASHGGLRVNGRRLRVETGALRCATGQSFVAMGIVLPSIHLDAIAWMRAHRRQEARVPSA